MAAGKDSAPHLEAQARDAIGESRNADEAVRTWMHSLGKDPGAIDDHWRHAFQAYERQAASMDGSLRSDRENQPGQKP